MKRQRRSPLSYGDYDKAYANFYANDYNAGTNLVDYKGYVDTTDRSTLTLSGSLTHEFETGSIEHALLVGAEYINTSNDNDRTEADADDYENMPIGGISGDLLTKFKDKTQAELDVVSLYLQDTIALTESLDFVLVGVLIVLTLEVDVFDSPDNSTPGSRTDEEFTPRAGFVYKLDQGSFAIWQLQSDFRSTKW